MNAFAACCSSFGNRKDDDGDVTRLGTYRHRYHMRAIFQSLVLLGLVGVAALYNTFVASVTDGTKIDSNSEEHRRLNLISFPEEADPAGLVVLYILGMLYMFLALAIVCDEFFVPALEEMSSPRHLNLSMDVAGATLMAAGGSAPEFFTAVVGTFQESDIGIGTIIGSAVFNVLFVIAMCSVFAKEELKLTWWPLFRDSFCYAIGIIVLGVFVGISSKNEIVFYEALVLFLMYILYTIIMWKNADIYKALTGKDIEYPPEDSDDMDDDNPADSERPEEGRDPANQARPMVTRQLSHGSMNSATHLSSLQAAVVSSRQSSYFNWQGTFRAGILKLMRDPTSWVETGGVGIVAKIAGNVDTVFKQIDENNDGHLDRAEVKKLFEVLECRMTEQEFEEVFNQLDVDNDGVIVFDEFNKWYTNSAELIRSQARAIFDELDKDESGTLNKSEIKALLVELDPRASDDDVQDAVDAMHKTGSREELSFEEFKEWYERSLIFEKKRKKVEEDMAGAWENVKPPVGENVLSWIQYLIALPLVLAMACTIPDVRRPGMAKYCFLSFFLSIAWIGLFSFLMVTFVEIIGNTFNIPIFIMGLTITAAGTSVPDLLSSVIVAIRGQGDMAVSSSIGSNIFDILVGAPIPWMLYMGYYYFQGDDRVVEIASNGIGLSLAILLGMLVFVIGTVHCQGWRLTKRLGAMMMLFYVIFVVTQIWLEYN